MRSFRVLDWQTSHFGRDEEYGYKIDDILDNVDCAEMSACVLDRLFLE